MGKKICFFLLIVFSGVLLYSHSYKPLTKNPPAILHAPWRGDYSSKNKENIVEKTKLNDCTLCQLFIDETPEEPFTIKAFNHCVVAINNYPYKKGHVMIVPYKHVRHLFELSDEALTEIMMVITLTEKAVMNVMNCESLNVGLNIGPDSGASIPDHLHIHIIPRWRSDTGFIVPIASTNLISIEIKKVYDLLKEEFEKITI